MHPGKAVGFGLLFSAWLGGQGCTLDRSPLPPERMRAEAAASQPPAFVAGAGGSGGGTPRGGVGGTAGGAAGADAGDPATTPSDAAVPRPDPDAGVDAAPGSGRDAATPDSGTTAGGGGALAVCAADADCADGFACYYGQCAQRCTSSSQCKPLDGAASTCSTTHFVCRIDCSFDRDCPASLECRSIDGSLRCLVPEDPTAPGLFDSCDVEDDMCRGQLACYRSDSQAAGPGYCTSTCSTFLPDCDQDSGATASFACSGGYCRFDCESGTCPSGMHCEGNADTYRCSY